MGRSNYAIVFGAASITTVLEQAGFAPVLALLDAKQRMQLQRYLDSVAVNPNLKAMADDLISHGWITTYWGGRRIVDPKVQRKANKLLQESIPVHRGDDRVQLKIDDLLDAKAFQPTTDNPDEAEYMERVRYTLQHRGVWLRINSKFRRNAEDPSMLEKDPHHFEVWLSLGPDGDHIPTKGGRIDRKALLATQLFGAGYYTDVHDGQVQRRLHAEMKRLSDSIQYGRDLHWEMSKIRDDAKPGVVFVSDLIGGADFPSSDIWNAPHKALVRAMELNNEGTTYGCRAMLVLAAIGTRQSMHLITGYIDDTTDGASLAVKGLKVLKTAGEVAEIGLTIVSVAGVAKFVTTGAVKVGSRVTIQTGRNALLADLEAARKADAPIQTAADQFLSRYAKSKAAPAGFAQELETVNKLNKTRAAANVGKPKFVSKGKI
jgi:hypothetical protein